MSTGFIQPVTWTGAIQRNSPAWDYRLMCNASMQLLTGAETRRRIFLLETDTGSKRHRSGGGGTLLAKLGSLGLNAHSRAGGRSQTRGFHPPGEKKKRAAETALTVVVGEDAEAGIWLESTPIQQWESSVYLS